MPTLRVVLDTNVLVSGIAYPGGVPGRIVAAWRQGGLVVVLSRYILDELARVLPRLNHRLNWSEAEFADFIDILAINVDLVEPDSADDTELRDAADQPVLGTLLTAKADYLVTGDRDLLTLATRYPIITPAEFWSRHGG
ncbi:putative toxin-antitoxin system toxin component, PIN family [Paramagnetospirillum kuznetsovii]|uniref:Putative toxin-antitoxin system toxin component, PIN family n=1 Tax=Paramagnetospirillum kuznetsovii TaxID=2053833 RepID=A0A364NSZ9_9PROT|nr:putative toxin-antitoxin system toxin component, PIN family [Paramagnetospirillum kuznetsovii]RAU20162.1 putative toxin-antitoxin system toxin component, PIN family [Paramagnetospirillum kuznetsovii]